MSLAFALVVFLKVLMEKFDEMATAWGRRVQARGLAITGAACPVGTRPPAIVSPPAVTTSSCSWHLFLLQRSDPQLLAQFYYADEELNQVAAELDSLDGRKEPQRCTLLVSQFRSCQVSGMVGASGCVSILGSS